MSEDITKNPFIWLYTHCRAIGMTRKSLTGTLEHDICLFTIDLKSERDALRERVDTLEELLYKHYNNSSNV